MKQLLSVLFFHIFFIAHGQQIKDLAAVKKDDKWGAINTEGKMVIPCVYDAIEVTCSDLIAVKKDGKFGFIDHTNNIKIAFQYDTASGFYEQKAVVKKGNKFGYIDEEGKLIIDYKFDGGEIFSDGLAGIKIENLWGFCNQQGTIVIQPTYRNVSNFKGNYCIVTKDFLGVINRKANEVVPFEYNHPIYFLSYNKNVVVASKDELYRDYILKLNDTTYSKVTERNLEHLRSYIQIQRDLECEEYIPANYLIFYNKTYGEKERPIGLVFPKEEGPGKGVISKDGKVVFCCYNLVKFLDPTHFAYSNGKDFEKATVVDTNGRRMDINGYEFDYIKTIWDNVLIVMRHGKWGGVNMFGEQVIDFKYDNIYGYREGTFLIKALDKYYVTNLEGYRSEPLPFYVYRCLFFEKVIIVESEGKYGVLDYKGNVLFEPQFDESINFYPNSMAEEDF